MDEIMEHRFSIKRVHKASDEEYIKALSIYNTVTPNDIKTNTNEISMWLSRNEKDKSFDLLLFVLYLKNEIIGFAMLSYIPKGKIIVYDYIALKEQYRINIVFFAYFSLIQNYIISQNYDVAYYVVEISNKNDGKSVDKESRIFKKLICLEGFGRIKAKYETLPLGINHYESNFTAFLYVKTNDTLEFISKETFLNIVSSIYYEYYLSWYTPILPSAELNLFKKNKIDYYHDLIKKEIVDENKFEVEYVNCPLLGDLQADKSFGHLQTKVKKPYIKYILLSLLILIGPLGLILVYNYTLGLLGISINNVNSIIGGVFTAILSSVTALFIASKKKL